MKEHLVTYLLIKKRSTSLEYYTYFSVVVVKLNALVWFGLVFIAAVTKGRNSEATFDRLLKLCNCTIKL